jgi:hypothetical protein
MKWFRDAFFIATVTAGLGMFGANLDRPRTSRPRPSPGASADREREIQVAVGQVDAAFRGRWAAEGVTPAAAAPELIVARRVALGLMGTVPSLEEIRQFESLPPGERLPWWLDHVLQDRRSADFLAERLARAYVGTEDGPFIFYRRRRLVSWLSGRITENTRYDEVVRSLIAGEGLWTDNPATNFVSVTAQNDQANQPDPTRLAGRVARAFLGLRLDCAQCHNHPFADWTKADFEGLASFFGQTHLGFRGIRDGGGEYEVEDRKTGTTKAVEPHVPFAPDLVPDEGGRRERLAAWVTHPKNPYLAAATVNRVWALLFGRPLVAPVDGLGPPDSMPPVLRVLADDFAAHQFDVKRLIRVIAGTAAFRLDSATDHESDAADTAWAVFPLTRLRPEQVAGSILQAASVQTIDSESHILVRLMRYGQQNEFVTRYGDGGEDEFDTRGGTIPQRLLTMNGKMARERVHEGPFNTSTRIAWMAPDDATAIELSYLAVLARRPTPGEATHFRASLADPTLKLTQRLEDLCWALINSTEFAWNH